MNSDTWDKRSWGQSDTLSNVVARPFGTATQSEYRTDVGAPLPYQATPEAFSATSIPPHAEAQPALGPQPYIPPSRPEPPSPTPNRSLVSETADVSRVAPELSKSRKSAILLLALVIFGGVLAMLRGLTPVETGLIFSFATVIGSLALRGLDLRHLFTRAVLSVAIATSAAIAATSILPHLGFWPEESAGLLIAMTFATVGTLVHSRLCLGIALIVLVNLLFQGDGLGLMPGRTQIAVLALFGIGLLGGVTAGSRFIASLSLLALFLAHMHIMASAALPSGTALGVTLITALCAAALLRSTYQRGLNSAFEPMGVALCVFALATLTFQLVLLGGNGGPDMLETAPMHGPVVSVVLGAQMIVLICGLYDWFENRTSLQAVMAVQLVLAALTLMLIDPRRMVLIPGVDATVEMAFLTGAVLTIMVTRVLIHALQGDKAILTALCALLLMAEMILILRFIMPNLDVTFAVLVCAGVAVMLGGIMALTGRKTPRAAG